MATLDQLYARNFRHQRVMTALAAGVGLTLALAPHNERAIFIVDTIPSALAAIPLESPPEQSVMVPGGGAGFGGRRVDPRFLRALGGSPAAFAPGGPATESTGGPQPFGTAPPGGAPSTAGRGPQLAGLPGGGGPPVGSPFGPGFSTSPVGPVTSATPPTPVDPTAPVDPTTPVDPPIIPAVPEPMTWLLMIFGFFGCGSVLRQGRSVQLQAVAAESDEVEPGERALA